MAKKTETAPKKATKAKAVVEEKAAKPVKTVASKSRGKRKLTDAQVLEIVSRYRAGGETKVGLGRDYDVTGPTIHAILSGRTYAWLTRIGFEDAQPMAKAA